MREREREKEREREGGVVKEGVYQNEILESGT
jgi:hypothetical protein